MSFAEQLSIKLTAVFVTILVILSLPVEAKSRNKQSIDMTPCKVEVRVTGMAWPSENDARSSADNKWRKEVKSRFGEAFTVLTNAKDNRVRCYPGPLLTTRCEKIARPCEVQF